MFAAKGIAHRILDLRGRDAQRRGAVAVDMNFRGRGDLVEIAVDADKFGPVLELGFQLGGDILKLGQIQALQRVLIGGAGRSPADFDGRGIGDEDVDPPHVVDLAAQLRRHLVRRQLARVPQLLEHDVETGRIGARAAGIHIQHGASDIGIGHDDLVDLLAIGHHPLERGAVGGLDRGVKPALVVGGQEILLHDPEQKDRGADAGEEQQEDHPSVAHAPVQAAIILALNSIEAVLAPSVEGIVLGVAFVAQHARAQHGGQGDGHQA